MIVLPAVDLRGGACVQLVGGSYENEPLRLENPVAVARDWARHGFRALHIVDLDAATGRGSNLELVREIVRELGSEGSGLELQVGGGVRSLSAIEELITDGVNRVIVGTRAVEEPDWLAEAAHAFPGRLIVAADVRDRRVTVRGWTRTLQRDILDYIDEELNGLPLAGVLVTAVHREGQMAGTDLPLMEDVAELSRAPLYASGGVTTLADLRRLEERGVAAAVVGMALYTGALNPWVVAEDFAEMEPS